MSDLMMMNCAVAQIREGHGVQLSDGLCEEMWLSGLEGRSSERAFWWCINNYSEDKIHEEKLEEETTSMTGSF